MKWQEPTFVAIPAVYKEEGGEPILYVIEIILKKYVDVMPDQLLKTLSPRREIDHQIELVLGSKPPARVPYRMAPPELAKLRKQLNELLEAGFIRSSKTPFGAGCYFKRSMMETYAYA